MTQKELIRQEIENSIKAFEFNGGIYDSYEAGELSAYKEILDFIDSLPEEKPLTVEDIKTILDISFWNDDPEKILEEYDRLKK